MKLLRYSIFVSVCAAASCGNPFNPEPANPFVGVWRSERVTLVDGEVFVDHPNLTFLEDKTYYEGARQLGTYSFRASIGADPHGFAGTVYILFLYVDDEIVQTNVHFSERDTRLSVGANVEPTPFGPNGSYVKIHTGR